MKKQSKNKYVYLIVMLAISVCSIIGLIGLESRLDTAKVSGHEEQLIDKLEIEVGDKPNVLIWTSARWCSLCATMRSTVSEVAAEFSSQLEVIEVDIDDHPQILQTFSKAAPPTFYLFDKNRNLVLTFGAEEKNSFRSRLVSYIDLHPNTN